MSDYVTLHMTPSEAEALLTHLETSMNSLSSEEVNDLDSVERKLLELLPPRPEPAPVGETKAQEGERLQARLRSGSYRCSIHGLPIVFAVLDDLHCPQCLMEATQEATQEANDSVEEPCSNCGGPEHRSSC